MLTEAMTTPQNVEGAKLAHEWAEKITLAWNKSVEGILAVAELLADAEAALEPYHGAFEAMVHGELKWTRATVSKFRTLHKRHERIVSHGKQLPTNWSTIYAIAKLTEEQFAKLRADGKLDDKLQRHEVEAYGKQGHAADGDGEKPTDPKASGSGGSKPGSKNVTQPEVALDPLVAKVRKALAAVAKNDELAGYVAAQIVPSVLPGRMPALPLADPLACLAHTEECVEMLHRQLPEQFAEFKTWFFERFREDAAKTVELAAGSAEA